MSRTTVVAGADVTLPGQASGPAVGGSSLALALRQALPGVVLLVLVLRTTLPVQDPDTFWHLAAGDRVRETWTFSGPDPWSTMSTRPWSLHEWLPELVMSGVQQVLGLPGVAWLLPLGAAGVGLTLWWVTRRRAPLLVATAVLVAAVIALSLSLSLRPHLVSFALAAVTTDAWLRTRDDGRARWWLVPLTWVWACSHGMWFVGVVIGGVALVGLFLDGAARGRTWWRLALVPGASLAAAALTPVGPQLLLTPLAVREYAGFVTEWRSPALTDIAFVAFLVLTAATVLVWARRRRATSWTEILLVGLAIGFALLYVRTIAVAAAIIAPLAAVTLSRAVPLEREPIRRREVALTAGLAAVGLLVAALILPARAAAPSGVPDDLNTPLRALPTGTVICNDYSSGGWLIWAHPGLRPAIDGRTEVYAVSHVESYVRFQDARPGWTSYLRETGCRWALVRRGSPVAEALVAQTRWTVTARGATHVLLRAPG